jgi:threonine dehydrogenase-like Zn-dependent dehydrogenase
MQGTRIVIAGIRQARLEQFELPTDDLGPTEVVVRTRVTLLSGGTEGAGFLGHPLPGRPRPAWPHPTGYANVGEVVARGRAVENLAEGDLVYTMSHHASVARLDTAVRSCVPVPSDLAPEEAVFVRLITVPLTSVRTAAARAGDRAAVVGLGLVGNLGAQVLETAGLPTTGVDLVAARRELARRCGVSEVVDPGREGALRPEHRLVLEATGTARGTVTALDLAQLGGEVSLVGTPWTTDPSVQASDVFRAVHLRYLTLRSGWEWQLPVFERPGEPDAIHQPGSIVHSSRYAFDLLRRGRVRVRELITHRYAPSDCQLAYEGAVDHKDEQLGVVFQWS